MCISFYLSYPLNFPLSTSFTLSFSLPLTFHSSINLVNTPSLSALSPPSPTSFSSITTSLPQHYLITTSLSSALLHSGIASSRGFITSECSLRCYPAMRDLSTSQNWTTKRYIILPSFLPFLFFSFLQILDILTFSFFSNSSVLHLWCISFSSS